MRYFMATLTFVLPILCVPVGCASTDDPPSWQRAGLGSSNFGKALAKAARDDEDRMSMSTIDPMESDLTKSK